MYRMCLKLRNTKAFTIVELLIVIVLIAILASITVVSYNGITKRAEKVTTESTVASIIKMVETYAAANGGNVPHADWACVGKVEDYPAEKGYDEGWCHQPSEPDPIPNGNDHPVIQYTNQEFETLVARMPNGRIPEVVIREAVPGQSHTALKYRGVLYDSSSSSNNAMPVLQYYINGYTGTCPYGVVLSGISQSTIDIYKQHLPQYGYTNSYTKCEYRFKDMRSLPKPAQ